SLAAITPDTETEPDDRADLAMMLRADANAHGFIESSTDVDWWCAEENAGAMEVALTPPPGTDLELVLHPRDGTAETVVDSALTGGRETARVVAAASTARP